MSFIRKICLIGDVVVDVTLASKENATKLRLGGIVHAARGLWALNIRFSVGYFAPDYLDAQIESYLIELGCSEIVKLGNVVGSPYVFLIKEAKEIGDQGYDFLLRDEVSIDYYSKGIDQLTRNTYDDILVISGNYSLALLFDKLKGRIHIDLANNVNDLSLFDSLPRKIETIFLSTSSGIFNQYYKDSFIAFARLFETHSQRLILKENRGGSRAIEFETMDLFEVSSQTGPIVHSVGVGDVYDACCVARCDLSFQDTLILAAWVAKEYGSTTYPDDFQRDVRRLLQVSSEDLAKMGGVFLPWEARDKIHLYIAAPDFDHIDTGPIDVLVECLRYHNFYPRRPILENGQMEDGASKERRQYLFGKDIEMLSDCSIMIAVLLYNDPGTLIEIGLASAKSIPVIVFDPYLLAKNCMLTELPDLVTDNLDEVISEVFKIGAYLFCENTHGEK